MKKLIMIVAFLLVPFTAMAGMMPLTSSEMNNTTGQLGIGIDVTALDVDVAVDVGGIDIIPATALGMTEGFFQVATLGTLDIAIILTGDIDADIEITPVGIAIAVDVTGLGITVSTLALDVDCLADLNGDGVLGTPGVDFGPMDLLNVSLSNLTIDVNSAILMVDVLPTLGLTIGTTQL